MHVEPLITGNYYHIYNRGVNSQALFRKKNDYDRFIRTYIKYCTDVFDTLAYNLLGNHFHFIVQVKNLLFRDNNGNDMLVNPSKQLGHTFNSYAQAFNKLYGRTGPVFESPFHRKQLNNDAYIANAIYYTHSNAVHHGLVNDLRHWPYSSYHEILGKGNTFINREWLFSWFGGREGFIQFHLKTRIEPNANQAMDSYREPIFNSPNLLAHT